MQQARKDDVDALKVSVVESRTLARWAYGAVLTFTGGVLAAKFTRNNKDVFESICSGNEFSFGLVVIVVLLSAAYLIAINLRYRAILKVRARIRKRNNAGQISRADAIADQVYLRWMYPVTMGPAIWLIVFTCFLVDFPGCAN